MRIIEIKNRIYTVPEKWDELTGKQLVKVIAILNSKNTPATAKLVQIFQIITNANQWILWWAGATEWEDKLHVCQFLFEENELTKNLLPEYDGRYGPADDFNNLLMSEFVFTEQYFSQWIDQDLDDALRQAALNRLVATLYRPKKRGYDLAKNIDGDPRVLFNDNVIEYDALIASAWDMSVREAIGFWYHGCRNSLICQFPQVFGGGEGGGSTYGLWDVIHDVAEQRTLGDFEKVEKTLLKTVLMSVTRSIDKADALESQMKKV